VDESRQRLQGLVEVNTEDILESLGLRRWRRSRRLLGWLVRPMAYHFAQQVVEYDRLVGRAGLAAGAAWVLQRHVRAVEVAGQHRLPASGPLLVVANHPGVADTVALFISLPRRDLRIIAAERPFLTALPHTSRHLLYLTEGGTDGMAVLRAATRHLHDDGALLTFPAGRIEPDPFVQPGAAEALTRWSESIGLLIRRAPAVTVVPTIVGGVLSAAAQRHPLTRLRRAPADQERLGAMLQILFPAYRKVTVRVAFGMPLAGRQLMMTGSNAAAITAQVVAAARHLIEQPPTDWQPVAMVMAERHAAPVDQVDGRYR
jgi:hypothetical protein